MAAIEDLYLLGKYLSEKTNKPTTLKVTMGKIEHKDFKYIQLINKWICIRHKNDNKRDAIQYKTLRGAVNYVDKWLEKENK